MVIAAQMDQPNPALVLDTLLAYQRSAALRAAIELDLFRAIGEGASNIKSLAARRKASERGIRILCDYLTIIGFLQKENGQYRHTPTSATFLDPASPACIALISRFLGNSTMSEPCLRLADIVRKGTTTLPGDGSVEPENPMWFEFARAMAH
jgi:methyltransferase family protein